jgi:hypothetical protein
LLENPTGILQYFAIPKADYLGTALSEEFNTPPGSRALEPHRRVVPPSISIISRALMRVTADNSQTGRLPFFGLRENPNR